MESPIHSLASLFDQLGLDSTDQAIETFIDEHRPLQGNIELHQADFWSASQASFLKQEKDEDADWAEIVDQLDRTHLTHAKHLGKFASRLEAEFRISPVAHVGSPLPIGDRRSKITMTWRSVR